MPKHPNVHVQNIVLYVLPLFSLSFLSLKENLVICEHMHTVIYRSFLLLNSSHTSYEPGLEVCLQYIWKHDKNGILSWNYASSSQYCM